MSTHQQDINITAVCNLTLLTITQPAYALKKHLGMIHCNICGATTDLGTITFDNLWINAVCSLYIKGLNCLEPKLSGIGWSDVDGGPSLISMPDIEFATSRLFLDGTFNRQLRTAGIVYPEGSTPRTIVIQFATPVLLPDGTVEQTLTTGFVFHVSCFELLKWECHPLKVNVRTLNLFLRSFGVVPNAEVVNWGHNFADLYTSSDPTNRTITPPRPFDVPMFYEKNVWLGNPLLVPTGGISERLLADVEMFGKTPQRSQFGLGNLIRQGGMQDTFSILPPEILEHILLLLPSHDVLQARLASRSLLAIPLTKTFWLSRFNPGQRFEHIHEPRLFRAGVISDPMFSIPEVVYKILKKESDSYTLRGLENRRRIWSLVHPLASALESFALHEQQYHSIEPCGEPLASIWQPHLVHEDSARWDCAHGELLDSEVQPFHFGCRPLFKRHITLSGPVTRVKVSILAFHDTTYVTGLRFCFADGKEEAIGYILSDREVSLPTNGILRGLKVATAERGVHGLSVIDKHGMETATAGTATDREVKRLGLGNPVLAVKAYFDGMKMVFIGIPDYIHNATGPYSLWKKARDFVEISKLPTV